MKKLIKSLSLPYILDSIAQTTKQIIRFNKYPKRQFIWLVLVMTLIGCEVSIPNEQATSQLERWEVFTSSTYNYTLEYPAGWQAREYLDGLKGEKDIVATIIPPTPLTAVITIEHIQIENLEVEDLADLGKEFITNRYASSELRELDAYSE